MIGDNGGDKGSDNGNIQYERPQEPQQNENGGQQDNSDQSYEQPQQPNYGGQQSYEQPQQPNYGGQQSYEQPQQPNYGGQQRYEQPRQPYNGYANDNRYENNAPYGGYRPAKAKTGAGKIVGVAAAVVGCIIIGVIIAMAIILPLMSSGTAKTATPKASSSETPQQQNGSNNGNNSGSSNGNDIFGDIFGSGTQEQQTSPTTSSMPKANVPATKPTFDGAEPTITNATNPVPEIAEQLADGVVSIVTGNNVKDSESGEEYMSPVSRATGFVVSSDGYIMTNYHVISSASVYQVTMQNGDEYEAKYIGGDKSLDVAVLKIDAKGLKALKLGKSADLKVGEQVVAIGNPAGAGANLTGTVTVGYVSATDRQLSFNNAIHEFIQTDAAINPGNSGGPLVNSKGEVVGIVTLKSLVSAIESDGTKIDTEGIGFAIPVDEAMKSVDSILTSGNVIRPGIGITFVYYDKKEMQEVSKGLPGGALVMSVVSGSAAEKGGLKAGDVITKFDGTEVTSSDMLTEYVKGKSVGETIKFTVYRDGKTVEVKVTVGDINTLKTDD